MEFNYLSIVIRQESTIPQWSIRDVLLRENQRLIIKGDFNHIIFTFITIFSLESKENDTQCWALLTSSPFLLTFLLKNHFYEGKPLRLIFSRMLKLMAYFHWKMESQLYEQKIQYLEIRLFVAVKLLKKQCCQNWELLWYQFW